MTTEKSCGRVSAASMSPRSSSSRKPPKRLVAEPLKENTDPKDPGTYKISLSDEIHDDSLPSTSSVLPLQWKEIAAFENCDFEKSS